jgi:DNA modification methylase
LKSKLKKISEIKIKAQLPPEVMKNIELATLVGNSRKLIQIPDGRKYHLDNQLNDLSGGEWTFFTKSVLNTNYPTSGNHNYAYKIRKIHPSPKPPQLIADIISFFTKKDDLVLDYFAGVGGTLLGASLVGRKAVGVELNQHYVDAYKEATKFLNLKEQTIFTGDSLKVLKKDEFVNVFKNKKAKLILIDPPYFNMMAKKKTGDDINRYGNNSTPFTNSSLDLGNMEEDSFWTELVKLVANSMEFLSEKGHLVMFIKDMQPKGKIHNMLHATMVEKLLSINDLHFSGMRIWVDQTAKLYPYGYPFAFVATQIHQYILVFRKKSTSKK